MKLTQIITNIRYTDKDELIYVSNSTIKAVSDTIEMLSDDADIGTNHIYNLEYLYGMIPNKFDPFISSHFGNVNMWSLLRFAQERKSSKRHLLTGFNRLASQTLDTRKLDYENIHFDDSSFTLLPKINYAEMMSKDEFYHHQESKINELVQRLEKNRNGEVFVIDSLANITPHDFFDMYPGDFSGDIIKDKHITLSDSSKFISRDKVMLCNRNPSISMTPRKVKLSSYYGEIKNTKSKYMRPKI